ncbi:glycosyltransferase [Streptosporangium canum]|uniref:glycosyltransferase n=1 Tax=Streptosporangium canum TaxID=324952 RepID=UPI0015A67CAB|nr:glycosyltransferase [Streptosporangium canum]
MVGLDAVKRPAPGVARQGRAVRVLHVTECWGSGVASAVHAYIKATPDHDHWLLMAHDPADPLLGEGDLLRGLRVFADGHLARIRDVAAAYRETRPDIVHAHSSYAGFYVRSCPPVPKERIIYTPHCYAFERTDVGLPIRYGFRLAEALLAPRTGVVAAVSPREAELAVRLRGGQRVVYVPNVVPDVPPAPAARGRSEFVAISVGRICAQKDPAFLASAARSSDPSTRWVWIGDGDPALRRVLEDAGVVVTGWLAREQVLALLGTADVYVHTASWEGAPVSVLEAVGAGLPVVARDIPALRSLGVPDLVATPAECARAVRDLRDDLRREEAGRRLADALAGHTPHHQAARLAHAYTLALSSV